MSDSGDVFHLEASTDHDMHVLVLAGQPINEPIARHGPFVMNTQEEIAQAFQDYQSGKLGGTIEGADERYAKTQSAIEKSKSSGNWYNH